MSHQQDPVEFKWILVNSTNEKKLITKAANLPNGCIIRNSDSYQGYLVESMIFIPDVQVTEDGKFDLIPQGHGNQ